MTFTRKNLGETGETLATQFLLHKGYHILERNLKTKYGEIDILALDGRTTVLVEVKTKTSLLFGQPYEMVHAKKRHKLRLLAIYLAKERQLVDYRIDVVSVDLSEHPPRIEHLVGAVWFAGSKFPIPEFP